VSSPLVLDLDGDGVRLSGLAEGVPFDLLGTGEKVLSAWTDGRDAMLALDRNENGRIDDATELFGNVTGGGAFGDGFGPLAALDDDRDGAIDARDARVRAPRCVARCQSRRQDRFRRAPRAA
jgi:hypothetical protein